MDKIDQDLLSKCATEIDENIFLTVMVQPGAKTSKIDGIDPFRCCLQVRVKAKAQKGKANTELIRLLSKVLEVPTSDVIIIKGEKSRIKTMKIVNYKKKELKKKLNSLDI
jgi:uncharacterized protein (TIGR00251 family)